MKVGKNIYKSFYILDNLEKLKKSSKSGKFGSFFSMKNPLYRAKSYFSG
jgi:hypothetical protein